MKKIKITDRYLRYIAIVLVAVFIVAAALIGVEMWDRHQGIFPASGDNSDIVYHNGIEYVPKKNIETLLILGLDKFEGEGMADSYNNDKQSDFLMLLVALVRLASLQSRRRIRRYQCFTSSNGFLQG